MVDADVVTAKLEELVHRVERVRAHQRPDPAALASDEDALDLVSFNLMLAVQCCADVASHVIADEGWAVPSGLAESFRRLSEHGVVSDETANALGRVVGLRNVVAHGYGRVDVRSVFAASTAGLADLERFAREVAAWLAARTSG